MIFSNRNGFAKFSDIVKNDNDYGQQWYDNRPTLNQSACVTNRLIKQWKQNE